MAKEAVVKKKKKFESKIVEETTNNRRLKTEEGLGGVVIKTIISFLVFSLVSGIIFNFILEIIDESFEVNSSSLNILGYSYFSLKEVFIYYFELITYNLIGILVFYLITKNQFRNKYLNKDNCKKFITFAVIAIAIIYGLDLFGYFFKVYKLNLRTQWYLLLNILITLGSFLISRKIIMKVTYERNAFVFKENK